MSVSPHATRGEGDTAANRVLPLPPLAWRFRARVHDGVIAGGCLRDMYLGRPIKDVDIFVSKPHPEGHDVVKDGIFEIISFRSFGTPRELIDQFDIGLCQIAYDPDTGYHTTPAFWDDVNNKTLTLFSLRPGHYGRLLDKYPDFLMVDKTEQGAKGDFRYPRDPVVLP